MSDPNDRFEQDLQEDIRRFPEKYPRSLGGTRRDDVVTRAERKLDAQLPDETGHPAFYPQPPIERYPGEARDLEEGRLGVHALDSGDDTFSELEALLGVEDLEPEDNDDRFDPEF